MRHQSALRWLVLLIGILALLAAGAGLFWPGDGRPYLFTNHRGETVTINGRGLYFYDTVSTTAQMKGNDLVTLLIGLPLLASTAWLAFRGSLRGHLLLSGTLGFFLYTYMSMSMLTAYNALFLVYVALFSLSLYAFVLSMLSFNLAELPRHFSAHLPRRWIAGALFVIGGFLFLAWVGRIVLPLVQGQTPTLENTTTLVIQAMDLGLIVPLAILSGILLLRCNPWGYLLASVFMMKAITLGLAVSTMIIMMTLAGVPDSLLIVVPFLGITITSLIAAVLLLANINARKSALPAGQ
jgi:hypothetical protein